MDLYSCLLLPLVRDPNDPYLLVALGTTIFSGNLIAQTALRKSQPIVVIEDPSRSNFLPILLDDPGRESGDIGDSDERAERGERNELASRGTSGANGLRALSWG